MATLDNGIPIPAAAAALGVSEKTVRRRIKAGELPAYEIHTVKGPAWRVVLPAAASDVSTQAGTVDKSLDNAAVAAVLLYLAAQLEATNARLDRLEGAPPAPVTLAPREEIESAPSTQVGTVVNTVDNEAAQGVWARVRAWFADRP